MRFFRGLLYEIILYLVWKKLRNMRKEQEAQPTYNRKRRRSK